MSYEGIKLSPARLPAATEAALGAVIVGENISHLAGTISLSSGNVTSALGFTPLDKAGDSMGGMLSLAADPTDALHAATKQYVDTLAQGLRDFKDSVRVVAVSDITLSGEQMIDSVSVVSGDRVLVTGQAAATENGIYVVASGAWPRSEDAQVSADVTSGMYVLVTEGAVYEATSWVLTTSGAITLDATPLTFVQFSGAAQIVAGDGLTKTGNMLQVAAADSTITVNADSIQVGEGSLGNAHIASDAAIAYSKLNLSASLVDADIAAAAGIAYSKLDLVGAVVDADIAAGAGITYSKLDLAASIGNGDIAAGAAIEYSKLNLTGSIVSGDLAAGGIDYAKLNLAGSIVDGDVAAGAAIAYSKLSLTGSVLDADIAAGAEIADSKLATISTPGKVSDSALSSNVMLKDTLVAADLPVATASELGVASAGAGLTAVAGVFSVDFTSMVRTVNVVTAAGSVTCGSADDVVVINKGTGEATAVTLPASPATGKQVVIKDGKGDASVNNITVSADSGTIDGAASQVIDSDYGARMFVFNGSEWNLL